MFEAQALLGQFKRTPTHDGFPLQPRVGRQCNYLSEIAGSGLVAGRGVDRRGV